MINTNKYGTEKEMKKALLYKRIVYWDKEKLVLDDGTKVTLECSEYDCCAYAYGEFSNVTLDAVITDVIIGEPIENIDKYSTTTNRVEVKILHNLNPIAIANMEADDGNGGYYYSVGSMVINNIHHPIVDA